MSEFMETPTAPATETPNPIAENKAEKALFDDLDAYASQQSSQPNQPAQPAANPKEGEQQPEKPDETEPSPLGDEEGGAKAETEEAPEGEEGKEEKAEDKPAETPKKKLKPWKMVDELKKRVRELESQTEVKQNEAFEQEKAAYTKQLEELQAKNAELEKAVQFLDYSQSTEFQEKYQKPYEESFQKAFRELKEVPVLDGEGNEREITIEDIAGLVNMPLTKARETAKQRFGEFADDVMAQRKEIRRLLDAHTEALDQAKKNAGEQLTRRQQEMKQSQESLQREVSESWKKANEAIVNDKNHGALFKKVEGDEEYNSALQKGLDFADQSFAMNPMKPGLTPEQRSEAVRRHAAMRYRSAAFSVLTLKLRRQEAQMAALKKDLDAYKKTTPAASGGRQGDTQKVSGGGRIVDQMMADIDKLVGG